MKESRDRLSSKKVKNKTLSDECFMRRRGEEEKKREEELRQIKKEEGRKKGDSCIVFEKKEFKRRSERAASRTCKVGKEEIEGRISEINEIYQIV